MAQGRTIGIFVVEDEWLQSPQFSDRHLQFCQQSLRELKSDLAKINVPLFIFFGNVPEIFAEIKKLYPFSKVFSHTETGLMWTFQRDLKMKDWFKHNQVEWIEYPQFANVRGLKYRDKWNSHRSKIINRKTYPIPSPQQKIDVNLPFASNLESFEYQFNVGQALFSQRSFK